MAELKQQLKKSSSAANYGPSKRKGNGFTRKCASLVKEQRARIYILRRCATMLLCWSGVYCYAFHCFFTNQLTPCMNTGWQG